MDHSEIIEAVRGRKNIRSQFGYGITTADKYMKHIQACAGEGACSTNLPWSNIANAPAWDTVVKEAGNKLVYSNEDTQVKSETVTTNSSSFKDVLANKDTQVPPKTIMVFQNIVTSPKKDRDGDVLRTEGAEIDQRMPLLWQHMHVAPIGRMLEVVGHNEKELVVTSAVIDSALGNDTANLIEFGALRISHGFIPKEFKELEPKEHEQPGYEITKFEIMEESVVSVPSNTDAIIEAVSRGKLADPLVKGWAQHYYDNRPTIVTGVDMSKFEKHAQIIAEDDDSYTIKFGKMVEDEKPEDEEEVQPEDQEEIAEDEQESEDPYKEASAPEAEAVEAEAKGDGDCQPECDQCGGSGKSDDDESDEDDEEEEEEAQEEAGEAAEDDADDKEITPEIKGGRVLSKGNEYKIASAKEMMDEVAAAPDGDVKGKYKAMAERSSKYLKEVLEEAGYMDDKDDDDKSVEQVAKHLLVLAESGDPNMLKRVALVLGETADAISRQQDDQELRDILESLL